MLRSAGWNRWRRWRGGITNAVSQFVSSEITIPAEDFLALVAFIWLVIRMGEQVSFQVGPLIKAATANGAFMRGLFHVKDLVNGQGSRLTKTFATFCAFERFLLGMNVAMVSQVVLTTEGLATKIARVWSFISVCPLMNQQVV